MTGLEPATSGVTGRRSNQLSYTRIRPRLATVRREGALIGMVDVGVNLVDVRRPPSLTIYVPCDGVLPVRPT